MFTRLPPHAAATLHLLLAGVLAAIATTARAQVVVLPNCNFQAVDLVPCMAAAGGAGAGGGGNISDACCSSLNKALDAGHRCVCSLLLSNGVFASLVTNLLTLPLVLPLPGCFLFAPSLAACQATLQQQTSAQPAAAASTGGGPGAALPSPPQAAAVAATPPVNKRAGRQQADDGRTRGGVGDGSSEAPSPAGSASRSNACRGPSSDEGRACILTFAVAMAVFWFNHINDS
ncbi:unnamed protein product [Urochloa decumbens]|uniref:Bifunctional inhibitor/plant lipid transfer protein/seed storage helical domain-containing protein n=1 Tax=Urochloa decumbens TaxID=240449 RepID=A0ABC9DQF7_9POAL